MNQQNDADLQQPGAEPGSSQEGGQAFTGGPDETRGIDLGGLLAGLLGSAGGETTGTVAETGGGVGDLLGSLLGGGDTVDLSGPAGDLGISPSVIQAIVPLIAGALLRGEQAESGVSRAALVDLAEGKAGAADAVARSGLLQEIMHRTGLDKKGALGVIVAVLKALGLGKQTASNSKPKPKPKPRPKPKPSASAAKPHAKPKPKPATHAASGAKPKPKPKPKPAASAAHKPKPKPRPKRSGEVSGGEGAENESAT